VYCIDGSTTYHSTYLRLLASTYRYNEIRLTDRLTYSVRSASPAELNSLAAFVQLKYTNLRIVAVTRPIHNTPTPREVHLSVSPRATRFTSSYTLFNSFVR
jgi:hypothetical protein